MDDRPMADIAHTTPAAPLTEDAFLADRQHFWLSFGNFTLWVVIALVVMLILMAIFLV